MTNIELFDEAMDNAGIVFRKKNAYKISRITEWIEEHEHTDPHKYLLEAYFSRELQSPNKLLSMFEREIKYDYRMNPETVDLILDNKYFESAQNNLPAWSEAIFPKSVRDHIMAGHTIGKRFMTVVKEHGTGIRQNLSIPENEFKKLKDSIEYKLQANGKLNKIEEKFVAQVSYWDTQDYYPRYMSENQIEYAVREAYMNARKIGKRQYPGVRDIANIGGTIDKGNAMYQGRSGDLGINIWFNLNEMKISTAYPVKNDPKTIRHDKLS